MTGPGGAAAVQPSIRLALAPDLPRIVGIYNASIPGRESTADLEPVSVRSRVAWFAAHQSQRRPIWVVEVGGVVVGWSALSDYKDRAAYDATAEVSIYLAPEAQGFGLGRALLGYVIEQAPHCGVRSLLWVSFAHNDASNALARRFGFQLWGRMPRVTELDGVRRDITILGLELA